MTATWVLASATPKGAAELLTELGTCTKGHPEPCLPPELLSSAKNSSASGRRQGQAMSEDPKVLSAASRGVSH